jgi:hypothetical protein
LHDPPAYSDEQVQLQDGTMPLTEDAWLLHSFALVHTAAGMLHVG